MSIEEAGWLDWPISKTIPRRRSDKLSALAESGIYTIWDLLTYLPREYLDQSYITSIQDARDGQWQTLEGYIGRVSHGRETVNGRPVRVQKTVLYESEREVGSFGDGVRITWFERPHLVHTLRARDRLRVHGCVRCSSSDEHPKLYQPEYDVLASLNRTVRLSPNTGGIIPMYHLPHGMTQEYFRKMTWAILCEYAQQLLRSRPGENRHSLENIVWTLHFPREVHHPALARAELAADEALELFVAILYLRGKRWNRDSGPSIPIDTRLTQGLIERLPAALTSSQKRAIAEIRNDLTTAGPLMNRTLQGGCVNDRMTVALCAVLDAVSADVQSVLVASDPLLAEQYLKTIIDMLGANPIPTAQGLWEIQLPGRFRSIVVAYLTTSTKGAQRRSILHSLRVGGVDLLIGTRRALENGAAFRQLGLTIIDRQNAFDPQKRERLFSDVHCLTSVADPTPLALQLIAHPHMDFSILEPDAHNGISEAIPPPGQADRVRDHLDYVLKMANHIDPLMLERALVDAEDIYARDPELQLREHQALLAGRNRILKRLQQKHGDD